MMGIKKTDNPLPKTHKDEQTKGRELKKEKINNAKEKKKKLTKLVLPFCSVLTFQLVSPIFTYRGQFDKAINKFFTLGL